MPMTTMLEIGVTVIITLAVGLLLGYRLMHRVSNGGQHIAAFVRTDDRVDNPSMGNGRNVTEQAVPSSEMSEVMTDEHRVIHMLDVNGGQMPQSRIVEETEWSKSKISRLLSKMEDQSQVRKISQGRENLIVLEGLEEIPSE